MAKETTEEMVNEQGFLMSEIEDAFEKTKDYSMTNDAEFDVQYPTGFLPFDYKGCGRIIHVNFHDGREAEYDSIGLVDGSVYMIIGRSGCGKSTYGVQIASNVIRPFPNGLMFVDITEATGMMKDRLQELTKFTDEEFSKKVKMRNAGITIDNVYKRIKIIHDKKISNPDKYKYDTGLVDCFGEKIYKFQPTVYLIDSIPYFTTEKIADEDEMSGQMSVTANAKALAQFYRRITQICKEANIIFIAINHINEKVETSSFAHTKSKTRFLKQNETLPGGNAPIYSSTIFRMDDGAILTSDKELGIDGCVVTITNVKSRSGISGPMSATDLVFNYVTGFDPELTLYLMLKNAGRVNGAGAYLYFGDRSDYKFSQKNLKTKLATEPEFLDIFATEVVTYLKNSLKEIERLKELEAKSVTTGMILDKICSMNLIN
jgi:RecA/RadA recombinase